VTSDSSRAAFHRQIGSTNPHIKKNVIIRPDCPSYIINVSRPTPHTPRPTQLPYYPPIRQNVTPNRASHIFIPKERSNYFRLFQLQHYKSPSTAKTWEEKRRTDKGMAADIVFPLILRSLTWGEFLARITTFYFTHAIKGDVAEKLCPVRQRAGIASRSS